MVKTVEQQSALMLHRARQLLVEQRTRLTNAIRAHMAEFGIAAAKGPAGFTALLNKLANPEDHDVPDVIRPILAVLVEQWRFTDQRIEELERQIPAWHKSNADSQRVAGIPQIGPIIASALVATVGDASRFKNGRELAASPWLAELLTRKKPQVAAVALANKIARMAWAILVKGGTYQAPTPAAVTQAD